MDFGLPHLVAIGGYLRAHIRGIRVEILDLNYEGGDSRKLLTTLKSLEPFLMIGLSGYSSYDHLRVMSLARFLRSTYADVPLVTGGYHVSALPKDVLFEGSPFDAAVVGEGELPMRGMVQTLLGGGRLEQGAIWGPSNVPVLDDLPPYDWGLLERYWPRAHIIGRKLQIYLSRGCPYRCTFCMERAKTEYAWRAFSEERAVDELSRLARFTDLKQWVVNLADPLFGFRRRWRRTVLRSIVDRGLLPRQYWTLTRSDDLDDEDVELLAKARFSIGIGIESGSPKMLRIMQKTQDPERYLGALRHLAERSRVHGLNWAANIIVGHPGETPETLRETRDTLHALFTSAPETCGWLSFDPFRLYPGALVHEQMDRWSEAHGTRFYHPEWWKSWYDAPFRAEHIDPSASLDFEGRIRFMFEAYRPLLTEIHSRFRGQGRSVDRVFERSLAEQERQLSPAMQDRMLKWGAAAKQRLAREAAAPVTSGTATTKPTETTPLAFPIGLHVRDPWVRRREQAVRRLLEEGVLRTDALIEALLRVAPEKLLPEEAATATLTHRRPPEVAKEGIAAEWLPLRVIAMGLEALEPAAGDYAVDLAATHGYVAALMAHLVGEQGAITALHPGDRSSAEALGRQLVPYPTVTVVRGEPTTGAGLPTSGETRAVDRLWLGGALPRFPRPLRNLLVEGGRAIMALGPRFGRQDLVCLVRQRPGTADRTEAKPLERIITSVRLPVLAGPAGWLAA